MAAIVPTVLVFARKLQPWIALLASLTVGLGIAVHLLFMGVLTDNNAPNTDQWFTVLVIFAILALVCFLINLVLLIRRKR